jgi:hypothetical protein
MERQLRAESGPTTERRGGDRIDEGGIISGEACIRMSVLTHVGVLGPCHTHLPSHRREICIGSTHKHKDGMYREGLGRGRGYLRIK